MGWFHAGAGPDLELIPSWASLLLQRLCRAALLCFDPHRAKAPPLCPVLPGSDPARESGQAEGEPKARKSPGSQTRLLWPQPGLEAGRRMGRDSLCVPAVSPRLLEEAQAAPLGTWDCWNCWKCWARFPAHSSDTGSCALISAQTKKCLVEALWVFSLLFQGLAQLCHSRVGTEGQKPGPGHSGWLWSSLHCPEQLLLLQHDPQTFQCCL